MANVGDFVGDMVGTAVGGVGNVVGGVGNVVGDVVGSVGDIATDLGGGIAGLAQDTGSLAQDVYNNTVNDPGAMMGIANVAGRVAGIPGLTAVAGPASIALGYMGQGERDKTLGINNPTVLGRLARSLVPSIVQRPVFDFLGVTGGPDSFGGYGTEEAEQEGVAGIDTGASGYAREVTGPVDVTGLTLGGSEFGFDPDPDQRGPDQAQIDANISRSRSLATMDWDESDPDTSTDTSTDTGDMQDPDSIDYGYDEEDWAEGGAVGFFQGGIMNAPPRRKRESRGKGIERSNRGMVWKFAEGNMPEWMKGVITPKDYSLKFNRGVSADVRAGVAGDRADVNLGVDERIFGRNLRGDVTIPTKPGLLKFLVDREMNEVGPDVTTTGASFSAPVLGGILSAKKTSNPYLDRFQANYAKDFGNAGRIIAGMQEVNNRRALQAAYERAVLGGQGRVDVERTPDGETSVMGRLSFPLN
jgi:hypothetical protein